MSYAHSEEDRWGVHEAAGRIGRSWEWLLGFGILTVLAGIAALVWPGVTIVTLAVIFGIQLFIGGIYWFVRAMTAEEKGTPVRILLAVVSILAGLVILRYPVHSAFVFPLVLGAFWIVNGIMETFQAVVGEDVRSRGWAVASGVLSLLAGIVLLGYPGIGLVTIVYVLGIWLVVYGVIAAVRAVRMRPHAAPAGARKAGPAHA